MTSPTGSELMRDAFEPQKNFMSIVSTCMLIFASDSDTFNVQAGTMQSEARAAAPIM